MWAKKGSAVVIVHHVLWTVMLLTEKKQGYE